MAKRMMVGVYLDEGRKFATADVLDAIAAFLERTSRRQIRHVGRQARDLVKIFSLLVRGIGNTF